MSRAPWAYSALPLLSASQISVWQECERKWAWRYVTKIRTPQHPSAAFGQEVDDTQLQPYLRDGRPFDYTRDSGYVAAAGLAYLPKPQTPGMEVQKHFAFPSQWVCLEHDDCLENAEMSRTCAASKGNAEFGYQGYMDLWLPDSSLAPDMPGGVPCVIDFKTTSDLKWAKSPLVLSSDVQAMLYAADAIYETGSREVDLGWIYFQTRGARKSKRTYLRVTREHVAGEMRRIGEDASELLKAKFANDGAGVDPLSLPPSPSQCEAYGGCPFRDKCNLSPVEYVEALEAKTLRVAGKESRMDNTESLLASLAAKKAKKVTAEGVVAAMVPAPTRLPVLGPADEQYAPEPIVAPASAPEPEPVALGINPPEKDLPPPPPAPVAKRGPGRPKKVAEAADGVLPGQLPLPFPEIDYEKLAKAIVGALVSRLSDT